MPRKLQTAKENLQPSKKRNLLATQDDHANKEDCVRNVKKKRNDCVRSGTKSAGPLVVIPTVNSEVQTATASASSALLINRNKEECEDKCLTCMDLSKPSNLISVPLNPNPSIVPYNTTCMRIETRAKKSRNLCATDASGNSTSDILDMLMPEVLNTLEPEKEIRCFICMDTKTYLRFKNLECGHDFHAICLRTWLKCNEVCPICMPYSSERNNLDVFIEEDICEIHEGLSCSICMDTVEPSSFETLSCSHSFHVVCIQTWFAVKDVCPVCMGCNPSDSTQDDFSDLRLNMQCMICRNTEEFPEFEFLSCDHGFHAICLGNWFQVSAACPICVPYDSASSALDKVEGVGDSTDQCVICMGTEESFEKQNLPCGHRFHVLCIQTWFQIKNACPICIPSITPSENLNLATSDSEELKCMICMGAEESLEFDVISCDLRNNIWHEFHSKCMEMWFQVHDSCPVCFPCIAVNSPPKISDERDSEIVRCAICVDTEEYTDIEFLACCHSFHSVCIRNWLKRRNKCPICNTVININSTSGRRQEQSLPCS